MALITRSQIAQLVKLLSASDNTSTPGVGTAEIVNLAVTTAKLAADAVETAKIKDAAVTVAKLAADAVETAKIRDLAVTEAKLAEAVVAKLHTSAANVAAIADPSTATTEAIATKLNELLTALKAEGVEVVTPDA